MEIGFDGPIYLFLFFYLSFNFTHVKTGIVDCMAFNSGIKARFVLPGVWLLIQRY